MPLTPEAIRERGASAQRLLDDATLNAVFEEMLASGYGQWLGTDERQIREREEAHARARAILNVRSELRQRVDAALKLEADEKRKEQRKKEI